MKQNNRKTLSSNSGCNSMSPPSEIVFHINFIAQSRNPPINQWVSLFLSHHIKHFPCFRKIRP
ncbi:hypothetical protein PanWU01x14_292170 [Parasponia andersonii]|uniref:Uncharacterized protein n=1 Tax=Parasponia andersonii TaxID=3476 RepID=A0A2P5AX86_PARAD|nr:hypothetical protein PanWU01x14_292170 [Parasponia andersonii]